MGFSLSCGFSSPEPPKPSLKARNHPKAYLDKRPHSFQLLGKKVPGSSRTAPCWPSVLLSCANTPVDQPTHKYIRLYLYVCIYLYISIYVYTDLDICHPFQPETCQRPRCPLKHITSAKTWTQASSAQAHGVPRGLFLSGSFAVASDSPCGDFLCTLRAKRSGQAGAEFLSRPRSAEGPGSDPRGPATALWRMLRAMSFDELARMDFFARQCQVLNRFRACAQGSAFQPAQSSLY